MHLVISNDDKPALDAFVSWQFTASGNYSDDCARGRGLARQFLAYSGDDGFTLALAYLVGALVERGAGLTGLEIGFLSLLSRHIAATPAAPSTPPLSPCSA
jgi:hypothetical protein